MQTRANHEPIAATKGDPDVADFCREQNLSSAASTPGDADDANTLRINDTLLIRFGRPDFEAYLSRFSNLYHDR